MSIALQQAGGGDVDLRYRVGTADRHLVVEQETGWAVIRPLVFYRRVVGDGAEKGVPDISERCEGSVDSRTLELAPESEHITQGGQMGRLGSDVDLEPIVGVGYAVDRNDRGLHVELGWESGEV